MCLARLLARNIRTDSRRRTGGLPCNCQFHASVTAEPETRSSHSIDETVGVKRAASLCDESKPANRFASVRSRATPTPPRGDAYGRRSLWRCPPLPGTGARDALAATSAPASDDGHVRTLATEYHRGAKIAEELDITMISASWQDAPGTTGQAQKHPMIRVGSALWLAKPLINEQMRICLRLVKQADAAR